jgi:hypothetical protein
MSRVSLVSRETGRSKTRSATRTRASLGVRQGEVAAPAAPIAAPPPLVGGGEPLSLTSRQVCDEIFQSLARQGCPWG